MCNNCRKTLCPIPFDIWSRRESLRYVASARVFEKLPVSAHALWDRLSCSVFRIRKKSFRCALKGKGCEFVSVYRYGNVYLLWCKRNWNVRRKCFSDPNIGFNPGCRWFFVIRRLPKSDRGSLSRDEMRENREMEIRKGWLSWLGVCFCALEKKGIKIKAILRPFLLQSENWIGRIFFFHLRSVANESAKSEKENLCFASFDAVNWMKGIVTPRRISESISRGKRKCFSWWKPRRICVRPIKQSSVLAECVEIE